MVLFLGSQLGGCGETDDQENQTKPAPIRPVKTILVKPMISKFQRTYYAVVLPSQEVELSFRVSGRLIKFPIRNVEKISKGDIIAQLETREFTNKISQMASQLEQAKAQLRVLTVGARKEDIAALQAGVAAAQAQVTSASQQMERSRKLAKKGIVTRATLDTDRTSLRVANAELVAKKQELIKGKKGARQEDVDAQEAVIRGLTSQMKALKDDLSDATLRAPFDGVIAVRKVENFSNIQAKEAIATFQSLATPNMSFDIPAPDIPKLAKYPKLDIKVILDGFPGHKFIAKRREFSTKADASTQTYRGRVAIQNANGEPILPGMTGNIIVTARQQGANVFMLPVSAIASEPDGKPFVWVVNPPDNKVGKRSITTGEASGADVLISSGVKKGDMIIGAGLSALQEDMIVKPVSSIGE